MVGIGLAEVVEDLRSELQTAASAANGDQIRFEVGAVELTLSVQVSRETTPGAKVKFWVMEAGADISSSKAATQQVKLTLSPANTAADQSPSAAGPVWIRGDSVDGER